MRATKNPSISVFRFADLPESYEALCAILLPRTIHDGEGLDEATRMIDLMAGHSLTPDQEDYLSTLSELVAAYEEATLPPPPELPPHEFLAAHLENIGMSAAEWGRRIGIDRATASRLLRGKRKFSVEHIRRTAQALGIAPECLLGEILS